MCMTSIQFRMVADKLFNQSPVLSQFLTTTRTLFQMRRKQPRFLGIFRQAKSQPRHLFVR